MIPEAAVEAAAITAFVDDCGEPDSWQDRAERYRDFYRDRVKRILEAAAPHMLAGLREMVEDMERQPPSEMAPVPGLAVLIRRAAVGDMI